PVHLVSLACEARGDGIADVAARAGDEDALVHRSRSLAPCESRIGFGPVPPGLRPCFSGAWGALHSRLTMRAIPRRPSGAGESAQVPVSARAGSEAVPRGTGVCVRRDGPVFTSRASVNAPSRTRLVYGDRRQMGHERR